MSEDFRSSEALPKFGRCENPKIKCRMKKLFFSNVWNYHSSRKFLTKKSYLKTPGLENSRKIFRNLPKSSEIFRNLPKLRFLADGAAQDRSEYFSNMWNYHSSQNVFTKKSYLKMPGLENSWKIFRNLPKSSEIFRNRRKSSDLPNFGNLPKLYSSWPGADTRNDNACMLWCLGLREAAYSAAWIWICDLTDR